MNVWCFVEVKPSLSDVVVFSGVLLKRNLTGAAVSLIIDRLLFAQFIVNTYVSLTV